MTDNTLILRVYLIDYSKSNLSIIQLLCFCNNNNQLLFSWYIVVTLYRPVAGTHSPPSVVVPMLQGSRRNPSVSGSRTMDSGRMSPPRSRHTPTADGMMTRERLPAGMSDDVPMSPVDVPKRDTTYRRTPWSKLRQAVISRRGSSMGHSVHPRHRTTPSPPTPQMGHHSSPELPSGYGKSAPKPARISPRANPY